jgi:hypothetical protein
MRSAKLVPLSRSSRLVKLIPAVFAILSIGVLAEVYVRPRCTEVRSHC